MLQWLFQHFVRERVAQSVADLFSCHKRTNYPLKQLVRFGQILIFLTEEPALTIYNPGGRGIEAVPEMFREIICTPVMVVTVIVVSALAKTEMP